MIAACAVRPHLLIPSVYASSAGDAVQEASATFFGPVVIAYLIACSGWMIFARRRVVSSPRDSLATCEKPWRELGWAGVAVAGILGLGSLYRSGLLFPAGSGWLGTASWTLNNIVIYSPLFMVLAIRRQGLNTAFLSRAQIARKILVGAILAVASTATFVGLRGELATLPAILRGAFHPANAANFLPVFLEGVALAFLFVRIRWALGFWPAILIPAILFAAGHVPGQVAAHDAIETMLAFFVFNTILPAAILSVVARSRDVIWIGIVHYVMDIAIKAFG